MTSVMNANGKPTRWSFHGVSAALRTHGIVLTLLVLVVVVETGNPSFLTTTNLMNISSQWAIAGILAVAQTYVIITGGFDLSIGSGFALCAVVAAALGQTMSPEVAFFAALATGLFLGLFNGLLVAGIRINPFIATVGTGFVANGIALIVAGNTGYQVANPDFMFIGSARFFGVPYSGMLLFAAFIGGGFVLAKTVYGQGIYAVGGNAEASRLAGLPVRRIFASAYVVSGLSMGITGILAASAVGSAQANMDPTIVFDVLTIVIVGGTSLSGGVGSMWRTAVGLAIIATISNGFNLLNVDPNYQNIVKGAIIIGALALDTVTQGVAGFSLSRFRRRPARLAPSGGERL